MQFTNSPKVIAVLFALVLLGCGQGADDGSGKPMTLDELIKKTHFVAKELHFNMQNGADHQFNISIFESLQQQLDQLKKKAAESDVPQQQKTKLVKACDSLVENFGRVTAGSAEYEKRFSAADVELSRQIRVLEQMQ